MRFTLFTCGLSVALTFTAASAVAATKVQGTVRYVGPQRAAGTLPVTQDGAACGKSQPDEALLVGSSGGVSNVVVSLEGVAGAAAPAAATAKLDQKGCRFAPHVQAVPTGSSLVIGNSDAVLHNVHGYRDGETIFNLAMPQPNMQIKRKLAKPGVHAFRCDAGHHWMSAYVVAFDHPYYAVTDAQGRFTLPDVPPGKYTLRAWHEGWERKDGKYTTPVKLERPVTIEDGKPADLSVELK